MARSFGTALVYGKGVASGVENSTRNIPAQLAAVGLHDVSFSRDDLTEIEYAALLHDFFVDGIDTVAADADDDLVRVVFGHLGVGRGQPQLQFGEFAVGG